MRPSPSRRCAELSLAAVLAAGAADACPCGAPAGAFPAWTTLSERLAVVTVTAWSRELGSYDASGRAFASPAGVSHDRVTLDLVAAWRVRPSLELALGVAGQWSRATQPGIDDARVALGDTTFRARWERPGMGVGAVPAVALWGGVRAPTGDADGRFGGLSSAGLGHWEFSAGAELRWSLSWRWSAVVGAELGARTPARVANATVTPGPRVASSAQVLWRPSEIVTLSLGAAAWVELGAWIDGAQSPDTTMWRVGPVAGVAVQAARALRVSASAQVDPLVEGFGGNVPAALRVGVGLTWVALPE